MRISALIERLRALSDEQGDLEVRVVDDYDGMVEHLAVDRVTVHVVAEERYVLLES